MRSERFWPLHATNQCRHPYRRLHVPRSNISQAKAQRHSLLILRFPSMLQISKYWLAKIEVGRPLCDATLGFIVYLSLTVTVYTIMV